MVHVKQFRFVPALELPVFLVYVLVTVTTANARSHRCVTRLSPFGSGMPTYSNKRPKETA